MSKIRHYWNPETEVWMTSAFALIGAAGTTDIEHVVHPDDEIAEAALEPTAKQSVVIRNLQEAKSGAYMILDGRILKALTSALYALLLASALWYLPFGMQASLGPVMLMLFVPLIAIVALSLRTWVKSAWLKRKVQEIPYEPVSVGSVRAIPSLWVGEKVGPPNKRPLVIVLALFLAFNGLIGRVALAPADKTIIIHPIGQERYTRDLVAFVPPFAWWEVTPKVIEGQVFGMLDYDEPTQTIQVLEVRYSVINEGGYTEKQVWEKFRTWANNVAMRITMIYGAQSGIQTLEDQRAGLLASVAPSLPELKGMLATTAREVLGASAQVTVRIRVVTVREYRKVML